MQSLHEQLNNEYENLRRERDVLKSNLRDVKNESRTLRETCERLEAKNETLQSEREALINNTKSLNNLRGEHSKLKVYETFHFIHILSFIEKCIQYIDCNSTNVFRTTLETYTLQAKD